MSFSLLIASPSRASEEAHDRSPRSPTGLFTLWSMSLAVRCDGVAPLSLVDAVRREVRAMAPAVPVAHARTLSDTLSRGNAPVTLAVLLLGASGVAVLWLALTPRLATIFRPPERGDSPEVPPELAVILAHYHSLTMKSTIDGAGRVVIPKALRRRLGLEGGETLEIRERDGRIEIEPAATPMSLVEKDGVSAAVPGEDLPPLTDDIVRETLERTRR